MRLAINTLDIYGLIKQEVLDFGTALLFIDGDCLISDKAAMLQILNLR